MKKNYNNMDYQGHNQFRNQGFQEDYNRSNGQSENDKKINDYTFQQIESFLQTQVSIS